jgi:outer membrane protein assembly factor BamD
MTARALHIIGFCLALALSACANVPIETRPDALYREGEDLYASRRYDDAIAQWKKVRDAYSSPELTTKAELKIADAYYDAERYIEAAAAYEEFTKLHPTHEKSPYALYRVALANVQQITGIDTDQTPQRNAVTHFEEFLRRHPKSEFAADARKKRDETVTMMLQHELYVARFYYRTGKYVAAAKRLDEALKSFPADMTHDETWFLLGATRLKTGDLDKAKEAFNRLSTGYPTSRFVAEASVLLEKHY